MEKLPDTLQTYEVIVQKVKGLYEGNISDKEAREAANNIIRFGRIALNVKRRLECRLEGAGSKNV